MERNPVLYAKNDYGDRYNFQDVFFNAHPVNKQNPSPIPPKKPEPPPPPPPPPPEKKKKRKKFKKPKPKPKPKKKTAPSEETRKKKHTVFKVITTILLLLILSGMGFVLFVISRINYSRENPDHESIIEAVGELKSDSQVQNIMIFGADNHAADENGRSDSMILLSIDKKHHIIKQTSFMRDLYVTIPDYGQNRINAAFSYGGAKLAVETIEYNFGIEIDNYLVLDYDSFTAIINALDGIDIELTEEEIDYINWQSWRNKQVESRDELDTNSYEYHENDNEELVTTVHLNGRQALWHARNRGQEGICSGDDFTRTARQRVVVNTILTKLQSANPFTLARMVYDVAPMITTNMNLGDTLSTSMGMPFYLGYDRMEFRVPQSFNYSDTWVGDAQVLTIDNPEEEKKALRQFVFDDDTASQQNN